MKAKDIQYRSRFGISLDEVEALVAAQGGRCAICNEVPRGVLCVDHCHRNGRVRGLLCRKCNMGIGLLRDDPELLAQAAAYLRKSMLGGAG